jgi:hypothetical protein
MAAPKTQSFPVQLRPPGTVGNTFTTVVRPPGTITAHLDSPEWLTTPGLTLEYRARTSTDGGATWSDAAGFTATSPTYMRDGVTPVEPGLVEEWSGAETRYQVQVTTTQAFSWGMTFTLTDAA